jgi:hypothetical protein
MFLRLWALWASSNCEIEDPLSSQFPDVLRLARRELHVIMSYEVQRRVERKVALLNKVIHLEFENDCGIFEGRQELLCIHYLIHIRP